MTLAPLDSIRFASTKNTLKNTLRAAALSSLVVASPAIRANSGDTTTVYVDTLDFRPEHLVSPAPAEPADHIQTPDATKAPDDAVLNPKVMLQFPAEKTPNPMGESGDAADVPKKPLLDRVKDTVMNPGKAYDSGTQYLHREARQMSDHFYKMLLAEVEDNRPEFIRHAAALQAGIPKLEGHNYVLQVEHKNWKVADKGSQSCNIDFNAQMPEVPLETAVLLCGPDSLSITKTPDGKMLAQGFGRFRHIKSVAEEVDGNKKKLVLYDEENQPFSWYSAPIQRVDNDVQNPLIASLKRIGEGYKCNNDVSRVYVDRPQFNGGGGGTDAIRPGFPYPIPYGGGGGRDHYYYNYVPVPGETTIIEREVPGQCQTVPEPGTLALMGIGVAGLAASRRKKQAK